MLRAALWAAFAGALIAVHLLLAGRSFVIGPGVDRQLLRMIYKPQTGSGWTLDRIVEDRASFEVARASGRIHEDSNRRRLREAVVNAAARIEYSPCDSQARPPFRIAVGALLLELQKTADEHVETATIAGRDVDATDFLNSDAVAIIREAIKAGLLYREDMPKELSEFFHTRPAKPVRQSGRFACETD